MNIKKILNIDFFSKTLLCLMSFLVPIFFYPSNLHYFINIKLGIFFGLTILVVIFWAISRLKDNDFRFPNNLMSLSILLILLTSLLSSIFSENPFISIFGGGLSLFTFLGIFMLFLLSFVVSSFFKEENPSLVLIFSVYISLALSQFLSLIYLYADQPNFNFFVSNSINTIGKWSDLGIVSAFSIILSCLIIETYNSKKILKIIAWSGLALSVLLSIIISEKVIWVSLGLTSLIYLIYKIVISRKEKQSLGYKKVPYATVAVILVSFLMLLSGNLISSFTDNWFNISFSEIKPSANSTFDMTKSSIQNSPYFGYGVNRFERAWQQYKPDSIYLTDYWGFDFYSGYSYFMSIPAQTGILGSISWLFFILVVIYGAIKLIFKETKSIVSKNINLVSSISIIFFMIVLSIHEPSFVLLIIFFIFLGIFISSLDRNKLFKTVTVSIEKNPKIGFAYIFSIVVLMILMIYVGYMSARQFAANIFLENAEVALIRGDKENAQKNINMSVGVFRSDKNLRALSEYYKILINDLLSTSDINKQSTVDSFRDLLGGAVNSSVAAINFDNKNYINYVSLANIYEKLVPLNIEGSYDESIKSYQNAISVNPKNPGLYIDMARVSFVAGKNDKAKEFINTALTKKTIFVDATFLLSQIQVKEGNINDAIKSLESTVNIEPNNSNLYFQLGLLRYNKSDYEGAISSFSRAITLNPAFANAKYFLGLSYDKVSDTSDAIRQFEDLQKMNPDNQEIQKILENLNSNKSALSGLDGSPENNEEPPIDES